MSEQAQDAAGEHTERQCRICLDGEDPDLGRLIRPCLCRGTISFVHTECLNVWRRTSPSANAFFKCPQCGYEYRVARTRAFGMAENTIFLAMLSGLFFVVTVIAASFVSTYFMDADRNNSNSWWYSSLSVASELIGAALRILQEENILPSDRGSRSRSRSAAGSKSPPSGNMPPNPSTQKPAARGSQGKQGILAWLIRRFLLGLPVVSVGSLFHIFTAGLLGPLHWVTQLRNRRRTEGGRDVASLVIVGLILYGAIKALLKVYEVTTYMAKRILTKTEDRILEVG